MALILCLETATEVCSVALFRDETLLGLKESSARNVHSSMLTVFIESLAKESGIGLPGIDALAVSMGPGSYTGLRIGVATAKGLCYALDKPMIAISTLQAMAVGMEHEIKNKNYDWAGDIRYPGPQFLFCPMIDARRMEVYCALYDSRFREMEQVRAEIIDPDSFGALLSRGRVIFGGEGAEKCKPALESHPNALFLDGFRASARHMQPLAAAKFNQGDFENLAYFEPFYLKDFVAGKPRVKGLR
ncbi:MAG: tRNA (adenosine(37)-N6)-threonylcarbamoyltransferase complex dimerization subunit type 1 TsaB [Bacteroidota bacterium]